MTGPNVEVWALPASGDPVCLTDLGDYELSQVDGEVGTVSLSYPAGGEGFDLLYALRLPYRRLEVEIRTDGTAATAEHALLTDAKGDATKPGSTWTITGLYLGCRMRHAACLYSDDGENGDTVITGTPGVIIRTLMVRAQARNALVNVDFSSFTNTLDSNGQPWAKEATLTFSPGRDYLSILQEMQTKLGMSDWRFTSDNRLHLYNPDTRGVDRSVPGQQVTLEYGRDFTDGPVTSSNRDVGTNVLGVGVNGMYVEAENTEARALLGEKIEIYADFGSVYDEGTLTDLTVAAADQAGVGAHSYSHELILGPDSPIPGVDYKLTDYILRAINGTTERLKVSQIVYRRDSGEKRCSVTLGDLLTDQAVKTRQMVDGLANGSAIVGTSTMLPDVDDGKAPAAPASVTASSTAYYDGGTPVATISAGWPGVLTNDDGTAIDDLSGYQVEYMYEAGQELPTDWQVAGITAGTGLAWGPVVQNKIVRVRVLAYDKWNHNGPYSPVQTLTTAQDGDAPPTPSTPQASSYLGLFTVDYDGKGSSGQAMPTDTREIEIHLSSTGPTFTPDRPAGGLALSGTYVGSLSGAGTFPVAVADYGTTYYARLVAVDKTGNASAASAAASAVLQRAADGDLAGLSVGKLITGIMSALVTISGIIRTAATGARVELDTTGLRCISSTGAVLFQFHIPTSLLTMTGKLIAGMGVGLGATVVVDPGPPPRIRLYPNATAANYSLSAESTLRPDGTTAAGLQLSARNTSDQTDGFAIDAWSSVVWIGHKLTSGAFSGAMLVLEKTGVARLLTAGGFVQVASDGRIDLSAPAGKGIYLDQASGASVEISTAGDITLSAKSGRQTFVFGDLNVNSTRVNAPRFTSNGNGARLEAQTGADVFFYWAGAQLNIGSGSSYVKTFVIPHPVDPDRWLVHGCIEAPEAAVEYRGVAELVNGQAIVELPSYFEAATLPDGRTVHVSMMLPDEPLTAEIDPPLPPLPVVPYAPAPDAVPTTVPESALIHPVAASQPRNGRFRIVSPAPDGTRVSWLVKAVRADVPVLDAEPLRSDVDVRGDGPYRYIANPQEAA